MPQYKSALGKHRNPLPTQILPRYLHMGGWLANQMHRVHDNHIDAKRSTRKTGRQKW